MGNPDTWRCQNCGNVGLEDGDDGFFYCTQCSSQAEDFMDTGVADEDFLDRTGNPFGGLYSARHPQSQTKTEDHDVDAIGVEDLTFDERNNEEDYYGGIRLRFSMMIVLTRPLTLDESEVRQQGEPPEKLKTRSKCHAECHPKYDLQAVKAWFRSLRKIIPLSYTLAVSFGLSSCQGSSPANRHALRVIYNIHGFGEWERSLSSHHASSSTSNKIRDLDPIDSCEMRDDADKDSDALPLKLLSNLEARYNEILMTMNIARTCQHIFRKLIESLWNFYQSGKDSDAAVEQGLRCGRTDDQNILRDNEECTSSSPSKGARFKRPFSDEELLTKMTIRGAKMVIIVVIVHRLVSTQKQMTKH
ncbi:hypothetical protein M0R45_002660 [Rubus argutus]|uniref:TATA box-binding protein-associated factor RNA polymerase I subunit B n=1 Tax=Rubus argutus TaxID=59490 RepID=A0AAW1VM88_RUBAR